MTTWNGILRRALFAFLLFPAAASLAALDVPINTVQFPEKRSVDVPFAATPRAPSGATLEGEVKSAGAQARIELSFRNLQPAVLFGGQINSYVLWAVSRDGNPQNLGELWSREENGTARFQTGLKEFAMIVTAEPIPGMARPSDLVVFISQPVRSKYAKNSAFTFSAFRPAVPRDRESVGNQRYANAEPLELYQARRIYEMGNLAGVADYDARAMAEAKTTLAQAANTASLGGSSRVVADYSRRTVSLVSTAARAMSKAVAEKEEAEAAARRRAELDALGQKATAAEESAAAADAARRRAEMERESAARAQADAAAAADRMAVEKQAAEQSAAASDAARRDAEEAQRRSEELRRQAEVERSAAERAKAESAEQAAALTVQKEAADRARTEATEQAAALAAQKEAADRARAEALEQAAALEAQRNQLSAEKETLAADRERVQKERDALQQRLSGALEGIATTRTTARGIVVSLPGILFDTGRATLKPSAQVGLAKMAGVLSVFPDMNLRVEGYTDSTGTDKINRQLSSKRAGSVAAFLRKQGIAATRIVAEGYGSQFPVASNQTPKGRAANRRVEVILAEGVVPAPAP
ncbi:MAG: OmpA family protein [Acidobacteriota bacterium]